MRPSASFTVAASSYSCGFVQNADIDILSANTSSILDLSSLQSLNIPVSSDNWARTYSIAARNNGEIDLSGTSTISGANSTNWLKISAESGGHILFGNVFATAKRTRFVIDGTASSFDFGGGLTLNAPVQFKATLSPTISLAGHYSFNHTAEADISLAGGIMQFDGSGLQRLEVGGQDVGVPAGAITNNFQIGQLMVGQTTQPTVVKLVDQVNNGNRGTSGREALYLQGFPGSDSGLRILGGSTLVIENLQLYVQEGDEWVHINSLFPPDTNQIAYDDGFIALSIVESDCDGNSIDDRVDVLLGNSEDCNENELPDECEIEVGSPAPGGPFHCTENCDPDCNINGIPDACDIADGTSLDCNANGVPDDCDIAAGTSADTNVNGIPDDCEDCNNNSIPDFQDLANCTGSAWCDDCNGNGVLDWCDTHYGTSDDVNGNIVPDECAAACQPTGLPDHWDLSPGISQDCQANGVPDECELAAGTSEDVNGNSVPDECEPDCQPNGLPDNWDLSQGISQDCQPNGVPDECDISAGTSDDANGNGIPDECEPDCQPNGIPDGWDIAQGTSEDCNENTVPDECDIASGTSVDTDLNSVPDECQDCNGNSILDWMDIASGTSEDCNENQMPDECETGFDTFQWTGPDGGSFLEPVNWDPAQVPGGDALLLNTGPGDNRAVLNAPGEKRVCGLTVEATGAGLQILRIDTGSTLHPASGTVVNAGGKVDLRGGALITSTLANAGGTLTGYGHVDADVTNAGDISGAIGRTLTFTGALFDNQPAGTVLVPSGSVVDIQSAGVTQAGRLEIRSQGVAGFTSVLTNLSGADVSLLGGTLVAGGFVNAESARFSGFGTIDANAGNEGDFTLIGDTQLLGDLHNDGAITLQDGTFLVMGDLTGSGKIIGNFFGKKGSNGLTVQGDLAVGAEATLTIANGALAAAQVCDIAINDDSRFDFTAGTLQLAGDPSAGPQTLEVLSENVGRSVTLPDGKRFSLNKLRLGPTATTVHLADAHDNAPGAGNEALYVHDLVLEPGITLDLRGLRIYYASVTPADPFDPGSGVTVIDTVGGGGLIPIGPPIKGDWDDDADVDLTDYVEFPACLTGPDNPPVPGGCAAFDFEDDKDVDLTDYGAFQLALPTW